MFKNFQKENLGKVQMQLDAIKQMVAGQVEFEGYRTAREEFNRLILQGVFGAEITGSKIKFNHDMPDFNELQALYAKVDELYHQIEGPLMTAFNQAKIIASGQPMPEDMSIPEPVMASPIPKFTKVKVKDVKAAIIGNGQFGFPMIKNFFTPAQVLEMAGMASDLRDHIRLRNTLIIAGVTLAVVGIATTGIILYDKKRKENELKELEAEEAAGIEEYDDEDDVPVVEYHSMA